jgi:hypothetical protein
MTSASRVGFLVECSYYRYSHVSHDTKWNRSLKIYVWTAKRSQKPQACVLFDAVGAVKAADRSTHNDTCRLWKNGYHMLRMCESTTMILESCLKKDGLTHGHPIFASIRQSSVLISHLSRRLTLAAAIRRVAYHVHPPTRGVKSPEKVC